MHLNYYFWNINQIPAYKNEVANLTEDNFQDILQLDSLVIVDVYTEWCGHCDKFFPIFEELCNQYGEQYLFMDRLDQATKIHISWLLIFLVHKSSGDSEVFSSLGCSSF